MQATPVSSISKYLKGDEAYDVLKDNQNRIWVRAKNQVYLFGKHVKTFFANATDFGDKICCLIMEKGKMYAFSHNHVFVFDEASQHFHTCFDLHVGMSPIFTYKNQKGEVILTVDKKGIYKVDFQSKSVQEIKYTQESSIDLSQSQISAFLEDNAHQTWIGCLQKGVYSLRKDDYPFHYMPLSNDEGGAASSLIVRESSTWARDMMVFKRWVKRGWKVVSCCLVAKFCLYARSLLINGG